MSETKELLRRGVGEFEPMPDAFDRVLARRDRKRRNQRVAAGVLGVAVFVLAAIGFVRLLGSERAPAGDSRSPFQGTWVSTDADGSTQTMIIRAPRDGAVEITVQDDAATVCSGVSSTMTGTGRLGSFGELVIPSPVYTCDDGSEPEALSGPPLQEQLRDLTFVLDAEAETITDGFGGVWLREGAEDRSPAPATSNAMWPQSSPEEVQQAQELADAGDPRYSWQIDAKLASVDPWVYLRDQGAAEIVARFLREELGWAGFLLNPYQGTARGSGGGAVSDLVYIRCAPGETNPLYPNGPWGAGGCAPTIDELRYEAVSLNLAQPGRLGPAGIWVVSRWAMVEPFAQSVPPTADATTLMEDFLQARIEGEGAERYVEIVQGWSMTEGIPLLYATTTGVPYERSEFELVGGPYWPYGDMDFEVRLFAEVGETVVEQRFSLRNDAGRLWLEYRPTTSEDAPTTENGDPVAVPYGFFDGEVTVRAAHPWAENLFYDPALVLDRNTAERLELVGDPSPVETGCAPGPAPTDADALARTIRSDPDFEATAPVAVNVGGIEALRMDVTAAPPGASVCEAVPAPMVLQPDGGDSYHGLALEEGSRIRLYLLDLPEGSSTRILAIAIVAPEARFDRVIEAATPILDSIEFHGP